MSVIENLLSPEVVRIIGWTLVHSLWQGVVVAVLLATALALLRRRSANARYVAGCGALLLMTGAALATAGSLSFRSGTELRTSDPVSAPSEGVALPVTPLPAAASPAPGGQAPRPVSIGQPAPMDSPPPPARTPWRIRVSASLEALLPWIVLVWLAGVIVLSMRLLGGWAQAERLKRCGTRLVAEVWRERLRGLADRLRVARPVRLLESTLAEVPTAIGWLRPVILIPTGALTGLTPGQLEALLAHELAHIRRYDYLVNVLQTVIETLLFYHPAVWWISRRVRVEREHCCDDLAVAACGDAVVYTRALAELETRRSTRARLAIAAKGGSLLGRVRRLVGVPSAHADRSAGWLAASIVVAVLAAAGSGVWLARMAAAEPAGQESQARGPQQTAVYEPIPAESGPTNTVTGIVIDEDNQPVADAPVLAVFGHAQSDVEPGPQRTARSGPDGRFVLEDLKPDGLWCFSVNYPRFAKQWEYGIYLQIPTETLDLPLKIRVHKPRTLNGVVVEESGTAVAGVRVTLAREWLPGSDGPVQGWLAWDLQVTETDGDGRFRLERLRPGKVTLVLDHPDYAQTVTDPLEVIDEEVRVTIKKGLTLRGRVTHDGKPLAGLNVTINAINLSHRSLGHWQVHTDAAGEFAVEHVTGFSPDIVALGSATVASVFIDDPEWNSPIYHVGQIDEHTLPFVELEARPGAADLNTREVKKVGKADPGLRAELSELPSGEAEIEVRLEPAPDQSGRVPEVRLSRLTQEENEQLYLQESPGADGVVTFVRLPAGTYRVGTDNYKPPNYAPKYVAVGEGKRAEAVLRKGPAKLTGVVHSGGQRLNLRDLEWRVISCELPSPDPRIGTTPYAGVLREDGSYEIDGLAYGRYLVTVMLAGSWPYTFAIDTREPDAQRDIELPSGRITGKVVAELPPRPPEEGRPAHRVFVKPRDMLGSGSASPALDEQQEFRLEHVPEGIYVISFPVAGKRNVRFDTMVKLKSPGDHVHAELEAPEQTGWIAGAIAFADADVAQALSDRDRFAVYAVLKEESGYNFRRGRRTTVERGAMSYRLTDVPPGTYAVSVMSFRSKVALTWIPDVEVRAGLVRTLDITIPQGREVRILPGYQGKPPSALFRWRLRLPTGDWVPYGSIVGSHGQRASAPRFSFVLAYGEYVVEAHFGGATRVTRAFTVEPSEGVQEIVVQMPAEGAAAPPTLEAEEARSLANLDFEAPPTADEKPPGWKCMGELYESAVDKDVAHGGRQSGRIRLAAYGRKKGAYGTLSSTINAGLYRGRYVRYSAYLRTQGVTDGWAGVWLHIRGASKRTFAFDPKTLGEARGDTPWTRYELVLPVPEDDESISFGVLLSGNGTTWVDDFAFEQATIVEFREFWREKVARLGETDWRTAFSLGSDLAELPPEEGYAILRESWGQLERAEVRQQMLKAWFYALPYPLHARGHPHLLDVVDLGMRDDSPAVRRWATHYLRGVAFQDFSKDTDRYAAWYDANRGRGLAEVLEYSLRRFVAEAAGAKGKDVAERLGMLANESNIFRDLAEARSAAKAAGLPELLERLAHSTDVAVAQRALTVIGKLKLSEEDLRRAVVPLIDAKHPQEVRKAAVKTLADPANAWAVDVLLDAVNGCTVSKSELGVGSEAAEALGRIGDPRAIPTLIGVIDADNSYATVYGVGYFALRPLTGVDYRDSHHGPWWRKWWEANKGRYPKEVQVLPIPDYPKTAHGKRFAENPPDPATVILEPSVDDLLEMMKQRFLAGEIRKAADLARPVAAKNDPKAIPTLIGMIDADNSYWTIYGIGYFALRPLTGVDHQDFHHGPWWRKWWEANKGRYPKEVQTLPIPDLPKTAQGKEFAKNPPDPAAVILEPSVDDLLEMMKRRFLAGEIRKAADLARAVAAKNDPKAIPTLIGIIDADNSYDTVYGVGYFGLEPLTEVEYQDFHHGPWWRKWWEANKSRFPEEVQALAIPDLPKTAPGKKFAENPPDPATIILEPTLNDLLATLKQRYIDGQHGELSNIAGTIAGTDDPRAIPTLIGLIEADNTYDTVYGVGYFGLGRLTGVQYDESHDGAWWRAWWEKNNKHLPKDVQALEIPKFPKVEKRPADTASDVADVPSQEILVGGDQNKRYFLIGAAPTAEAPADGRHLLLVMPGGDGSADFHPFVKRIYKYALPDGYLVAQLVAPQWDAEQSTKLVWPTHSNPWKGMKFSTEEFVHAVIADVDRRHKVDARYVLTLSWSSGGPAAYATSLYKNTRVTGSFVAMSVFKPKQLPPLEKAAGHAYYILHSPDDFIPLRMAEQARDRLRENKARVELATYEGGHGWHGDIYGNIRQGVQWLEQNRGRRP